MAQSVQIAALGTASAPEDYTIPNSLEFVPLAVRASFDGTGASGNFYPCIEFIGPGGLVSAECPCFTAIAAGGSADVTWFRLKNVTTAQAAASVYNNAIVSTADVRSYWTLDETSGGIFSDSGPSARTLNIVGSVALGASPLITSGHSAVFSGTVDGSSIAQQYAISTTGYGTWPGDNSITVMCWYRGQASGSNNPQFLCMDNNNFRLFQFRLSTTGKSEFITFKTGGATGGTVDSVTTINDGARHFIASTFDASTLALKAYVDGALDNTAVATGTYQTNTPQVTLAARTTGVTQNPIGGQIDEVALFSRALTATEIAHFYTLGTT